MHVSSVELPKNLTSLCVDPGRDKLLTVDDLRVANILKLFKLNFNSFTSCTEPPTFELKCCYAKF